MNLFVLISCMHQYDFSIVQRTNVQTNCVVVNQCDCNKVEEFDFVNKFGQIKHCTFVSTTERGLSRSRNMAISFTPDDAICKICDDDETLDDCYESTIINAYRNLEDASIMAFEVKRKDLSRPYPTSIKKLNFLWCNRVSSVQITFRINDIRDKSICFDEQLGSGTGNGGGEDNKFMVTCWRKRLKCYFYPQNISVLAEDSVSQWFKGYDKKYFKDCGFATRRTYGLLLSLIALPYYIISHYKSISASTSLLKALFYSYSGVMERRNRINPRSN